MSFENVVHDAIFSKLSTSSILSSKQIPIYDDVPQLADDGCLAEFPYIVIGDDSFSAWDTDSENGVSVDITIHVWSRFQGRGETKEIQGCIYDLLHGASFEITGYKAVVCAFQSSQSFLDIDGKTRHGVSVFNMLIEKL